MAKYFKKRRISLRDIIFKPRKTSREERIETVANGDNIEELSGNDRSTTLETDGFGSSEYDCEVVSKNQEGLEDFPHHVARNNSDENENIVSDVLAACSSDENDDDDDKYDTDDKDKNTNLEPENEFMMNKYFDSISLSETESNRLPNQRLPPVDTRSSSSLSAITGSDRGTAASPRNGRDICRNKSPATDCTIATCATAMLSRRKQLKSPRHEGAASAISNPERESVAAEIIPIEAILHSSGSQTIRTHDNNNHEVRLRIPLGDISQRDKWPVRHANGHATPEPAKRVTAKSPVAMATPLHPPLRDQPQLTRHRPNTPPPSLALSTRHDATTSPAERPRSAHLMPLGASVSNPNIHQSGDSQFPRHKPLPRLQAKTFNRTTRSNPSLYVLPTSTAISSSSSSSSFGSFTSASQRVGESPQSPTPPTSPRPTSRSLRVRRVKVPMSQSHDSFDTI